MPMYVQGSTPARVLGSFCTAMASEASKRLDPNARAQAKQASRDADARAIKSGLVSAGQLKKDNGAFGWAVRSAKVQRVVR